MLYKTTITEYFNFIMSVLEPDSKNFATTKAIFEQFLQKNTLSPDHLNTLSNVTAGSMPKLAQTIRHYIVLLDETICEALECNSHDEKELSLIFNNSLKQAENTKKRSLDNSENNNNSTSMSSSSFFETPTSSPCKKPTLEKPTYSSDNDEELKLAIAESLKPNTNPQNPPSNSFGLK